MSVNIKRIKTPSGTRSVLTYWYQGRRYRPTLGYDLSREAEWAQIQSAIEEIHKITKHRAFDNVTTLAQFAPEYLRFIKTKGCLDLTRQEIALHKHLIPHFGSVRLSDIQMSHGLSYIERRSLVVAKGTVARELSVLMALLTLAVDYDILDKNRLRRLPIPKYVERERVASQQEISDLLQKDPGLTHLVQAALHTGLRIGKLLSLEPAWVKGEWLSLPPARSARKGNLLRLPLNVLAKRAVLSGIGPRIFSQWKNVRDLDKRFKQACTKAKIVDLHFHDLRHTFATNLQTKGVDYEVRAALLGHKLKGATTLYSHGGPEWDRKLLEAVNRLPKEKEVQQCSGGGLSS